MSKIEVEGWHDDDEVRVSWEEVMDRVATIVLDIEEGALFPLEKETHNGFGKKKGWRKYDDMVKEKRSKIEGGRTKYGYGFSAV